MGDQTLAPLGERTRHAVVDDLQREPRPDRRNIAKSVRGAFVGRLDQVDHSLVLVALWDREQSSSSEYPCIAPMRAGCGPPQAPDDLIERAGRQVHGSHKFLKRADVEPVAVVAAGRNKHQPLRGRREDAVQQARVLP